ncbi:hypothetical protein HZB00_01945 [Candidatus Woesearchaeota archaeon]|nr:hypothetical protein [Candidatus Woesearchaeota archaeon]
MEPPKVIPIRDLELWIDLEKEDKDYSLRDAFLEATISRGADTLPALMAAVYLAQFEDLNSPFVIKPVFVPDFHIGRIPYSSGLLRIYNHLVLRKSDIDELGDGRQLCVEEQGWDRRKYICARGAQLGRVYDAICGILEKHKGDKLFHRTKECYWRDTQLQKSMAGLLGYLDR